MTDTERARAIGEPCPAPNCCDKGWWVEPDPATGEAMQVQCEFCYTNPRSVFSVAAEFAAARRETLEKAARVVDRTGDKATAAAIRELNDE